MIALHRRLFGIRVAGYWLAVQLCPDAPMFSERNRLDPTLLMNLRTRWLRVWVRHETNLDRVAP